MEKLIVIVGPTAVGKTKLSIDLAKRLPAEIISGDSMQIYKGMDIGTGKVTKSEAAGIPHYMIDLKEPHESFSVAEYKELVQKYITEINARDKLPILVGGSGLYIQAVLYDFQFAHKRDEKMTKKLEKRLKKEGIDALYNELKRIDFEQAKKIHPNNHRRVIRALEIYETTGMTMSEIYKRQKRTPKYDHIIIGLEMERQSLYNQINQRVDQMVRDGLIEEVKRLLDKGYEDAQSMQAIGYKEIIPYLKGEMDLDTAIELLKRNTRRYAKRQYTWFKNKLDVHWYRLTTTNYEEILNDILSDIRNILESK
mgnify:FL=1